MPALLLVVSLTMPVLSSRNTTLAPGTTAPVPSTTVPLTAPTVFICAGARPAMESSRQRHSSKVRQFLGDMNNSLWASAGRPIPAEDLSETSARQVNNGASGD